MHGSSLTEHRPDGIRDTARAGPTSESSTPARLQLRPRVLDLLHIFSWPIPDKYCYPGNNASNSTDCALVDTSSSQIAPATVGARMILLDGANLAWGYGMMLGRRFKCPQKALSQGVMMALNHRDWADKGFEVKAVMPFSYVQGELKGLADGGSVHSLLADNVVHVGPKGGDLWRNTVLWKEYEAGRLVLVKRPPTEQGRKLDDQTIIKTAHELGAYVCSNDQYRDHRKDKKLGFRNQKRQRNWETERKFGFKFHVATGLADELLSAMWQTSEFSPRVGINALDQQGSSLAVFRDVSYPESGRSNASSDSNLTADEDLVPKYHAMPPHVLPVVFEPIPNGVQLTMMLTVSDGKRSAH